MIGVRLEPELSLLVRCCRWNFSGHEKPRRVEIPTDADWHRIVMLARRHRVQGLVWNALAQQADRMPEDVAETLSSDARSIAATNMGLAAECNELQQVFKQSKAELLFVKGLTVSALAYRSPLLKMGWDIDLLIDPGQVAIAAKLLRARGYALRLPSNPARLQAWHMASKESIWYRNDGFHIELHTRLADNGRLIPTIDVHSPRQFVEVMPNVPLPTLAEEELFAYLAVHGASSAWFRLKWISDFAALMRGRSPEKLIWLFRRSQELGAGRAAGQALLLADHLFDVLQAVPTLRDEIASDRAAGLLCRAALRIMSNGVREPTEQPLGTLTIHWTQFLLLAGLGYKLSELRRQGNMLLMGHEP